MKVWVKRRNAAAAAGVDDAALVKNEKSKHDMNNLGKVYLAKNFGKKISEAK